MANVIDATTAISITVITYAHGAFVSGSVTYSPGQTVPPGTVVTIGYDVTNNGYAGMMWGGLYDNATPTPNLIGGYWEENVAAGATIHKTVSVTINESLAAQLLCGHVE